MKKLVLACALGTGLFTSCVKDNYDLDDIDGTISPEIAVPLVKTSIEAKEILSIADSSMLNEDANNLLQFVFSDTIYSVGLTEFVDIPNEQINYEFQLQPLVIDDVEEKKTSIRLDTIAQRVGGAFYSSIQTINGTTDIFPSFPAQNAGDMDLTLDDAPFTSATFSEGVLKMTIKNGWPTEITDVEISFKRSSDGVAVDTLRYPSILPGQSLSDSIFMQGKTIEKAMLAEFLSIAGSGSGSPVLIDGSDTLGIRISGYDMVVVAGTAIFPNQNVLDDTLNVDIDLGFGEELETIAMKGGDLSLNLDYQIAESARLYIELPYATKGSDVFLDSIDISPGPTVINHTFDLTGFTIDLTKGGTTFNSVETRVRAAIVSSNTVVPFDTANVVMADVSIENIDPLYIDGYFGSQTLSMDLDTNDFDLGGNDVLEKMAFADPSVTLGFHNTFGIPMEISSLFLKMKKNSDEVTLTGAPVPFTIQSGDILTPGIPVTSSLLLETGPTNIDQAINLWPDEVITAFSGDINPNGKVKNYAADTSKMDVTFDLTVPLYMTIDGFQIRDTMELPSDVFKSLERALIRTNIENEFPLEAEVALYVTDKDYVIVDSLTNGFELLVSAAPVDGNGETTGVSDKQTDLIADEEAVIVMQDSSHLIMVVNLSTGNNGAPGKIYSTQSMRLKLGLMAKMNVELKSEDEDEE